MTRGKHAASAAAMKVRQESALIVALEAEVADLKVRLAQAQKPDRTEEEVRLAAALAAAETECDEALGLLHRMTIDHESLQAEVKVLAQAAGQQAQHPSGVPLEAWVLLGKHGVLKNESRYIRRLGKHSASIRRGATRGKTGPQT